MKLAIPHCVIHLRKGRDQYYGTPHRGIEATGIRENAPAKVLHLARRALKGRLRDPFIRGWRVNPTTGGRVDPETWMNASHGPRDAEGATSEPVRVGRGRSMRAESRIETLSLSCSRRASSHDGQETRK